MDRLRLQSSAKVNLGLRIVGQRPDGYHFIDTVFQEIDFGDEITFQRTDFPGIQFETDSTSLPFDSSNLCVKAYELLRKHYPEIDGVKISLKKNIPIGAGLGGGSSNAATTLLGLAKLFALDVSGKKLLSLATELGADVPFFLYGGTAHGTGVGDQIHPLDTNFDESILLVCPDIHISTAWAYNNVKYDLTNQQPGNKFKGFFDKREQFQRLVNDFEPLVLARYSEIGDIKHQLMHLQADYVSLSGSGSVVFGIYADNNVARQAAAELSSHYRVELVQPVRRDLPRLQEFLRC
ncbi:MAG: 4-diphosphocytidyl-2-C-methyl-D-erythritol kinase [Candidatus Marinimicrobia bacterium]|nr:4-diphosphocytidyl-2-C-methyl-D-erythritol kinase [Candidatus Neomarinimicrobiota bacterium]